MLHDNILFNAVYWQFFYALQSELLVWLASYKSNNSSVAGKQYKQETIFSVVNIVLNELYRCFGI